MSFHHSPQETSEEVLQAREDLMKAIQTFLRKFSRIPFGEMPKVLLIAWERFSEIKHAFTNKQYQQEDIQELMSKLLEDMRNINEELSEFINSPSWNRPTFYNDDDEYIVIYRKHKEITPETFRSICRLEFIGELDFIDPILPGIDEDDCNEDDFDEEGEIDDDILQIEDKVLPLLFSYTVVDSDILIEEVDTFLVPEDSIPPSIESDLDSEGDIVFLDNLLNDDPIPEIARILKTSVARCFVPSYYSLFNPSLVILESDI
ncbi:hypothetical protein Tco_0535545 [Tanacetum coccineum]